MPEYTPEQIALAEKIANDLEESGCLHGDWCDAYRAALAAIRATTERAIKRAYAHADMNAGSDDDFIRGGENASIAIAADLEINEHLKDRPDAG